MYSVNAHSKMIKLFSFFRQIASRGGTEQQQRRTNNCTNSYMLVGQRFRVPAVINETHLKLTGKKNMVY